MHDVCNIITLEQYISTLPFNVIIRFGDYREMLDSLEKDILDLIITPQKRVSNNIEHQAFSSETIVLVAGNEVKDSQFPELVKQKNYTEAEQWLKQEKWYETIGDMEHLFRFWQLNFSHTPDFRPNYIVPNLNSIVRCLNSGKGLAVIPDFLCAKEIQSGLVKLVWKGHRQLKIPYILLIEKTRIILKKLLY